MSETTETKIFNEWMYRRWRPSMAYVYMFICIFDFFIAPILWAVIQAWQGTKITEQWVPMTLQGAGLFHVAMGAILGVAAWGRSQEKLAYFGHMPSDYESEYNSPYQRRRTFPPPYQRRHSSPNDEPRDPPTRDNVNKDEVVYGREQ